MTKTEGESEDFLGSVPSVSPTAQEKGVFSLCSGGVPVRGGFGRIPGKSLQDAGGERGGVISIYQYGKNVVVQRYSAIEVFELVDIAPSITDYVYDNDGELVTDDGLPVTV